MKLLTFFLLLLLLQSCIKTEIKTVFDNKKYLLSLCDKKKVYHNERGSYAALETYKDSLKNYYVFSNEKSSYLLYKDSIEFYPDEVIGVKSSRNTKDYDNELCHFFQKLLDTLDKLHITGFSSEEGEIPLTLYMKSGLMIQYIPDMTKINRDPNLEEYRKSLKEIGDSWYYIRKSYGLRAK